MSATRAVERELKTALAAIDQKKVHIAPTISHQALIDKAREFGYKLLNDDGLCYGFSTMAMSAFLIGDMETFHQRLIALKRADITKLASQYKTFKAEISTLIITDDMTEKDRRLARARHRKACQRAYLKHKTAVDQYIYFRAFFDGLLVHHNRVDKTPFGLKSEQNVHASLPLLNSTRLEELGGAKRIGLFTGIYNESELREYFSTFETIFAHHAGRNPIAMFLGAYTHQLTVGYHCGTWTLIDANAGATCTCRNFDQLIRMIKLAFAYEGTDSKYLSFTTEVYSTKDILERQIMALDDSIQKRITPEKAKRVDVYGCTWLYKTMEAKQHEGTKKLVLAGADLNHEFPVSGNALATAITFGNAIATKILLDAGAANPNGCLFTRTPYIFATLEPDKTELLKSLLKAGADPNTTHRETTPLHLIYFRYREAVLANDKTGATQFLEMARILLEAGANPLIRIKRQSSPHELATSETNLGALLKLEKDCRNPEPFRRAIIDSCDNYLGHKSLFSLHGEAGKSKVRRLKQLAQESTTVTDLQTHLHQFFTDKITDTDGTPIRAKVRTKNHSYISYFLNEARGVTSEDLPISLTLFPGINYAAHSSTKSRETALATLCRPLDKRPPPRTSVLAIGRNELATGTALHQTAASPGA